MEVKKKCEPVITKVNLGSYMNACNSITVTYHCLEFAFAAFPSLRLEFQQF